MSSASRLQRQQETLTRFLGFPVVVSPYTQGQMLVCECDSKACVRISSEASDEDLEAISPVVKSTLKHLSKKGIKRGPYNKRKGV